MAVTKNIKAIRKNIDLAALNNWFNLLYHYNHYDQTSKENIPWSSILTVETYLHDMLHFCERDDSNIVVAALLVWALARRLRCPTTNSQAVSFDELCNQFDLDGLAYLLSVPVKADYIPPVYRRPAALEFPDLYELTDEGILQLYANWHMLFVDQLLEVCPPLPITANEKPPVALDNFSSDECVQLEKLQGLCYIPATVLYANKSNENVYKLISISGMAPDAITAANQSIFEFPRSMYGDTTTGRYLSWAKKMFLPVVINDEILYSTGRQLWLYRTATTNIAAIVVDQKVLAHVPYEEIATLTAWLSATL